jgi:hypothetical protein
VTLLPSAAGGSNCRLPDIDVDALKKPARLFALENVEKQRDDDGRSRATSKRDYALGIHHTGGPEQLMDHEKWIDKPPQSPATSDIRARDSWTGRVGSNLQMRQQNAGRDRG